MSSAPLTATTTDRESGDVSRPECRLGELGKHDADHAIGLDVVHSATVKSAIDLWRVPNEAQIDGARLLHKGEDMLVRPGASNLRSAFTAGRRRRDAPPPLRWCSMHFSLPHERRRVVSGAVDGQRQSTIFPHRSGLKSLGCVYPHRNLTNCAEKGTDDGTAHLRAHMADDTWPSVRRDRMRAETMVRTIVRRLLIWCVSSRRCQAASNIRMARLCKE